ncbi:MAG: hypothetical protein MJ094_00530 [Saccharofermentans sp.]|nr:hypothetical protein [Saccharofermentans sp.]
MKKSIYEMNDKDLRIAFGEFGKTNYGKIVSILSFMIPFVMFIISIISFVFLFMDMIPLALVYLPLLFLMITLICFICGNRFFYKELKAFIEFKSKN